MSDSSPAIIWKDNLPVWDVAQTTAYPIDIHQKGKSITVYAYMSPYAADELKSVLQRAIAGYRREKRDVEIEREDRSVYMPLCDNHFVKFDNATGTPEAQRQWLDKYPQFKPSIIEHTFGGLRRETPDEPNDDNAVFDINEDLSGHMLVYQDLYDHSKHQIVRVNMTHKYGQPTEAQYREFRSARRNKFLQKRTLWTISENYNVLERLYDALIEEIRGVAVNGLICERLSKSDWVSSIPLWHKLAVVEQIFTELVEKNV